MEIKIDNKRTKEYAKELVSIDSSKSDILKNPYYSIKSENKYYLKVAILFTIFTIWGIWDIIVSASESEFRISTLIIIIFCILVSLFGWLGVIYSKTTVKKYIEEDRHNIVSLDKDGISFNNNNMYIMTVPWKSVLFARVFDESMVFFNPGTIIAVEKYFVNDIIKYLNDNNIEIAVYGLHQNAEVKKEAVKKEKE